MSDISQTIRIDDEFSAPLKNLAKVSFNASDSVQNLTEAIAAQAEEFEWDQKKIEMTGRFIYELNKQSKDLRKEVGKYITEVGWPRLKMLGQQIKSEASVISNGLRNISVTKMMTAAQNTLHKQLVKTESTLRRIPMSFDLGSAHAWITKTTKDEWLLGKLNADLNFSYNRLNNVNKATWKLGFAFGSLKHEVSGALTAVKEFSSTKAKGLLSFVTDKLPSSAKSAFVSADQYRRLASAALPHAKDYLSTFIPRRGLSEQASFERRILRSRSGDMLRDLSNEAKELFAYDLPKVQKGLEDLTTKIKPVVEKLKRQIGVITKSLSGVIGEMGQHLGFHSTVAGMYLKNAKQYWGSFFIGKDKTRMMAVEARLAASEAMYDAKDLERQMIGVYKDMIKVNIETLKVKSATLLQDAKSALSKGKNFLTETSMFKNIANSGFGRVAKSAITSAKMYGGFASAALPHAKNYLSTFIPKSGLSEEAALERRLLRSRSLDMLSDIGGEAKELFDYDFSKLQAGFSKVFASAKSGISEATFKMKELIGVTSAYAGEVKSSLSFAKAGFGITAKLFVTDTVKALTDAGSKAKKFSLAKLAKVASFGKRIGSILMGAVGSTIAWMGIDFIGGAMDKLGKMLLNKLENTLLSVRESIAKNLEDIDLSDKLNARWGEPMGKRAKKEMFDLAQELGESQRMVTGLMAKAAYEGIGTKSFTRAMRLADKVAALSPGKTTEEVASSILDNLKSGHDAGGIARLFGGGQVMERQLKRSGYERALRRGDVSKALDIAEKIAEQAGLTETKYKNATGGLAQDFQRVNNVIENIKEKLGEIYNNQLGNIVKRVREFLDSDQFKSYMKTAEAIVKHLGNFVSGFVDTLLDNIHVILGLIGGAFVVKTISIIRLLTAIPSLLTGVRVGTTFIGKAVNWVGRVTKLNALAAFKWSKLVKGGIRGIGRALKAAFLANPVTIIIGAFTALTYWILKATGCVDSLGGALFAVAKFAENVAHNIGMAFDNAINGEERAKTFKKKQDELYAAQFQKSGEADLIAEQLRGLTDSYQAGEISEKDFISKRKMLTDSATRISGELKDIANQMDANNKEYESHFKMKDEFEGVAEAAKMSNSEAFGELKKKFDELIGVETDLSEKMSAQWWVKGLDKLTTITDNTNNIREIMNREEDLKWLKAFSDRQIMHAYSSETSYNRNVNITASGGGAVETFRRYAGSPNRPSGFGG
jgi:hypothetical protein